jgi:hypothetical protein
MIHNVHVRRLPVAPPEVGRLLETLGSADDQLWRSRLGLPMVLDDGLRPGSSGGHGPVRYRVVGHEPGRSVTFAFERASGLVGHHRFDVRPADDGGCVLTHTLSARTIGRMRVLWPLLVRALHDTVLEDSLDQVEHRLTGTTHRGQPAPRRVRLVVRARGRRVVRSEPRRDGLLAGALPSVDAGDTWSTPLLPGDARDVATWNRAALGATPAWVTALMRLRDLVVRPLGLRRTEETGRTGFPEIARAADEILLGVDDRHLSFRVGLRVAQGQLHLVTLVQLHNAVGRLYWSVVRWFHPLVVRALVRRVPIPLDGAAVPQAAPPSR